MSDDKSVQDTPIVSHDSVTDVVRRQLRAAIIVKKRFTVKQLSEESGVGTAAIQSYMRNDAPKEPTLSRALSLAVVLGPSAVNAVLSIIGYTGSPLDEPDELQPAHIVGNALTHLAVIGRAAADNRIDHTEEVETTEAADMLIATVLPLSSAGRAA